MNDINERLAHCFSNVFPDVKPDEIPQASTTSLAAWDSLGHLTLLSAVAEEFGVEFAPEEYEELVSFQLIADRLKNQAHHG